MALFGWRSPKARATQETLDAPIGDVFDPTAFIHALDLVVPRYLDGVDKHDLIYPACTRTPADAHGSVRLIWEHTRLEAMRYVVMVPGRETALLIAPTRQPEMMEAFLRQLPHENTVIDFTGVTTEDLGIAINAGFNWLTHCASLAGVQPEKFKQTLTNFRKVVRLAQNWWDMEGAGARYQQMLAERQKPPLMLYLAWSEYTRLAKEVACAAIYGASIERAMEQDRERLTREFAERPEELNAALAALAATVDRLAKAEDPEELGKPLQGPATPGS
jgi:hypothetical protein